MGRGLTGAGYRACRATLCIDHATEVTEVVSTGRTRSTAVRGLNAVRAMGRAHVLDAFVLLFALWFVYVEVLGKGVSESSLGLAIAVFFVALVARISVAAVRVPDRRAALLLLATGICLWGAGSAMLTASGDLSSITFPAPGEGLFLASYVGMAAFLLMDVRRRGVPTLSVSLEATVICGATACLSALVGVIPLANGFDRDGVPLLLAVLYPLIDLMLVLVVLAQVLLGQRDISGRTAALVCGFALLATADSSFLLTMPSKTYVASAALDILYGLSFAVLAGAALTRPGEVLSTRHDQVRASTLVLAAGVAMTALVVTPGGPVGWCVTGAAVLTLSAAGWRLVLALGEARGAAEALRLSRTDQLTGLPNRRAVLQDLDAGLADGAPIALLLLDLDGFKDINDSMGHAVGDQVLVLLAGRMRMRLGHRLDVARLGGDEFALVARRNDPVELLETGRTVCALLTEPVTVEGLQLSISASIGIAIKDDADKTSTDLLRRADVAMYEAKASRAGVLLYEVSHDSFTRAHLRRNEELRRGIRDGELRIWYQPQVDAATQEVIAVEALVRWQHPTEGLLTPVDFLPEARRHGLMPALSVFVIDEVVKDARRWSHEGLGFRVALNCAPPEILGGFVLPRLYAAMAKAELPADTLLIEVTEDSFLTDPDRARERLFELQDMHVQSAIDDYGTGFSSLAYLRDLPVRELKIDRSFVSTMLKDPSSRVIVDTTTKMAHSLGLRLVAEGVEDASTAATLIAMDVDVLQGYHIAPPMPATSIGPWIRQWSAMLALEPTALPEAPGPR